VAAGQALALKPSGAALDFDVEWLDGSPFADYLIPGLFLAIVNGGLNLTAAFGLAKRSKWADVASLAASIVLVAWITIQTRIIGYQHWSQLLWWLAFCVMTVLSAAALVKNPPHSHDRSLNGRARGFDLSS
jgi:peptidoglycan/LPS O-acetylase OafA/YrhL